MNTLPSPDRIFPHSGGSEPRRVLRPPRLPFIIRLAPIAGVECSQGLRAWATRRAAAAAGLATAGAVAKPD